MQETFELPVTWKTTEYLFPAELATTGYSYKIYVEIFGKKITFERDEERNFRAIISDNDLKAIYSIDIGLLEETAAVLAEIFDN